MKKLSVLVLLMAVAGCGMLPSIPFVAIQMRLKSKPTWICVPSRLCRFPWLKQSESGQVSAVPEVQQRNASFYPDRPPLPDAKYVTDNRNEVRMQRLGDRNWLVIPEAPTTAWPKMKQFLRTMALCLLMIGLNWVG